MRLLLIRHGESTGNADGRIQGRLDLGLSELGQRQRELLAERLLDFSIDALYSSPLRRARETAEGAAERLGLDIVERPALMERDVGDATGLTGAEVRERFPDFVEASKEGRLHKVVPGWESDDDIIRRVESALDEIVGAHAGKTVAAVTHGGVIGTFCRRALGMSWVRPAPFMVSNTGVTMFEIHDGDPPPGRPRAQLVMLNDTCHLNGL